MKRTISAEVGKGSVDHNCRKFIAANVDPERTRLNISYCNEPIRKVYHELFDDALARYNARQTRSGRQIEDYYEKICSGKQEKPFHELVIQIGNKDDTGSATEVGEMAKEILDEYFRDFRERNPNLHVFSAHLHMDEATPHLHIDFVPVISGSSRGLDTRVSLKKALEAQGFRGGTRSATEWNLWVQSEKEQLARVMERHGFEWEQKGTHEQHLSVIEYKKQERAKELAAVEEKLAEKTNEFDTLAKRVNSLADGKEEYRELEESLAHDPEYQLPEPSGWMTAKTYKTKAADPLVRRLKRHLKGLLTRYYAAVDKNYRLSQTIEKLQVKSRHLEDSNSRLKEECDILRKQNKDYALLRKTLGTGRLDKWSRRRRKQNRCLKRDCRNEFEG